MRTKRGDEVWDKVLGERDLSFVATSEANPDKATQGVVVARAE